MLCVILKAKAVHQSVNCEVFFAFFGHIFVESGENMLKWQSKSVLWME